MESKNLTGKEVIGGLLFSFALVAGVGSIQLGHTLIGILILIPCGLYMLLDIRNIPKGTFKRMHEKQMSTLGGKLLFTVEVIVLAVTIFYIIQHMVSK